MPNVRNSRSACGRAAGVPMARVQTAALEARRGSSQAFLTASSRALIGPQAAFWPTASTANVMSLIG
jgi:hypothetical protein